MSGAGNGIPRKTSRGQRAAAGFDFCHSVRHTVADMAARLPDLAHLDVDRIAIAFCQARKNVRHGLFASLTPLRFKEGSLTTFRRGREYTIQRLFGDDGREMLYILSFYLPRFLDTEFREKLITILHELWHISPQFDGDLRRHPGRCYAHTRSQAEYDAQMARLADAWLEMNPPESTYDYLRGSFAEIYQRYGGMHGLKIRQPKLIPLPRAASA